jgi:hypothetical protein
VIQPFDVEDIVLMRDALDALRERRGVASNFASRFLQGTAQTTTLVKAGDQQRQIDALDRRLRDAHAHLTGAPVIQHGNADLTTESTTFPPLTRAEEAQEASRRG